VALGGGARQLIELAVKLIHHRLLELLAIHVLSNS
jgi:hypothetical protein